MRTIRDLGWRFTASCLTCDNQSEVNAEPLKERFGADSPVEEVRSRLRCMKCGRRDAEIVNVARARMYVTPAAGAEM